MKKNFVHKLAAVSIASISLSLGLAPGVALAGKGGSAELIRAAIASGSSDAIIAEIERSESLICDECIDLVTNLTEDARPAVREVAGWWFARRPAIAAMLSSQFVSELPRGTTVQVRNAADFLGATLNYGALPQLRAAVQRTDISAEARLAVVRAAGSLGHRGVNELLSVAMTDADASVRVAAAVAWRGVRFQAGAQPVVALLRDADASVRAEAVADVGKLREQTGRVQLEQLVVGDPDATVRRNAAWALGRLGNASSRPALAQASSDKNLLVSGSAATALRQIH